MRKQSGLANSLFLNNHISDPPGLNNAPSTPETTFVWQWTARNVALATLTVLGIGLIFLLLYRFYMVVFIFFVAVTLQVALRPTVAWLSRRGIRKEVGMLLIYTLLLALIVGFLALAAPMLVEQANAMMQQLPAYYRRLWFDLANADNRFLRALAAALPLQPTLAASELSTDSASLDAITPAWQLIKTISYSIFIAIAVLLLAFYWTLEHERALRRGLLLAPSGWRDELRALLSETETKIGAYFRGQAILCAIVGLFSMLGFFLVGVPYAFGLGLLMGIFEAIPVLGPTLGAIPVILMTLVSAPDKVLWVIALMVLVQLLENNLLVPRIMDQSVGVNAIVSLLAIAAFGVLFGIGGAILAIPLAAILQILLNRLLFKVPIAEEAPALVVAAHDLERNWVSVLRLEAQQLVQDVRKGVRSDDEGLADAAVERAEDLLEAIAADLDSLLTQDEQAEQETIATETERTLWVQAGGAQ